MDPAVTSFVSGRHCLADGIVSSISSQSSRRFERRSHEEADTSSGIALVFVASCEGEPPGPAPLTTVTAELRAGPTDKIAALVEHDNIVSDLTTVGAMMVDGNLHNAWGLAFSPNGPAWVSSNGRGLSQVYDPAGNVLLSVTVPPPKTGCPRRRPPVRCSMTTARRSRATSSSSSPKTGQSPGGSHRWGRTRCCGEHAQGRPQLQGGGDCGEPGKGSSTRPTSTTARSTSSTTTTTSGSTTPPVLRSRLPKGFAPFNIVTHDGLLYVSYAKQGPSGDDEAGPGNGFVDVYEPDGDLRQRLVTRGVLDSPWGMAFMAPEEEGKQKRVKEQLIVGNFGDGRINVFDLERHHGRLDADLVGALGDRDTGEPLVIPGLWALVFGPGAGGFDADDLYFTSGPNDEEDGIFGEIRFD